MEIERICGQFDFCGSK